MIYLTPRKDLLLLQNYNSAMHQMFDEVAKFQNDLCARRHECVSQLRLSTDIENARLNLEYRKSWVNEAAHRYGVVPPWDEPLELLEDIAKLLDTQDVLFRMHNIDHLCNTSDLLCMRAYDGNMHYLLGIIRHAKERDTHRLYNPLNYPALILGWFMAPLRTLFGPQVATGISKVLEGFAKQIGVLAAIALVATVPALRHVLQQCVRNVFAYLH